MQQNHGTMYAFEGELLMREQLRAGDFALHSLRLTTSGSLLEQLNCDSPGPRSHHASQKGYSRCVLGSKGMS